MMALEEKFDITLDEEGEQKGGGLKCKDNRHMPHSRRTRTLIIANCE